MKRYTYVGIDNVDASVSQIRSFLALDMHLPYKKLKVTSEEMHRHEWMEPMEWISKEKLSRLAAKLLNCDTIIYNYYKKKLFSNPKIFVDAK
jgi:hypothetical protein